MEQTCFIDPYWLAGLERRGAHFRKVSGDGVYFIIDAGSKIDTDENIHLLKEFLESQYSYKLHIGYIN